MTRRPSTPYTHRHHDERRLAAARRELERAADLELAKWDTLETISIFLSLLEDELGGGNIPSVDNLVSHGRALRGKIDTDGLAPDEAAKRFRALANHELSDETFNLLRWRLHGHTGPPRPPAAAPSRQRVCVASRNPVPCETMQ